MQEKHGYSAPSHPYFHVYCAWCTMKSRCYREKDKNYKRYGARGIKVCDRWKNSFMHFVEDMGHPKKGESLDRINVNGDYCKENCRWANKETQANNCRTNTYYEYKGEKLSETQWSRKIGIPRNKMMWWSRKFGIDWVIENIEMIRSMKRGMSNELYENTPFQNKRRQTHGALLPNSPLLPTHHVYRGYKERYSKIDKWSWDTFEKFLDDMGEKPKDLKLKRHDKNISFCKENCYWG